MFEDVLEFQDVKVLTDLTKNEMIKELQSLKAFADQNEQDRGVKDINVVAIVNVGVAAAWLTRAACRGFTTVTFSAASFPPAC